ncbi:hypothetical protein PF70_04740, partial [Pseudomonas asplenii]
MVLPPCCDAERGGLFAGKPGSGRFNAGFNTAKDKTPT